MFRNATDGDIRQFIELHHEVQPSSELEWVTISPGSDVTPKCLDELIDIPTLKQLDIFNSNCPFRPSEVMMFLRRWETKGKGSLKMIVFVNTNKQENEILSHELEKFNEKPGNDVQVFPFETGSAQTSIKAITPNDSKGKCFVWPRSWRSINS